MVTQLDMSNARTLERIAKALERIASAMEAANEGGPGGTHLQ
jgi:hypothetical protein